MTGLLVLVLCLCLCLAACLPGLRVRVRVQAKEWVATVAPTLGVSKAPGGSAEVGQCRGSNATPAAIGDAIVIAQAHASGCGLV